MPGVDGGLDYAAQHPLRSHQLRNASASSMQSPPASADATNVSNLSSSIRPTRFISQVNMAVYQLARSQDGGPT